MVYIITILYSVFLGSIVRSLLSHKYDDSTETVSVNILITKKRVSIILGISVLFLIDWICFLIIYQPPMQFCINCQDFILTLVYIPSISFLTFALILALDTKEEKYCLFLALYFIFSVIAESCWIGISIYKTPAIDFKQASAIYFISSLYLVLKMIWGILFYSRYLNRTVLDPTFSTYLSWVFKPALLIFLYNYSNILKIFNRGQ